MKWKYKAVMFLTLLIFCVGSVCATEPNNNTNEKISIDDSNGFNSDVIHSLTKKIIQNDPDVKELKNTNKILNDKVNNQSIEIS